MKNKALFIVAHPDDEVLSCGGMLQKFKKQGYHTIVHCLTSRDLGHNADQARINAYRRACRSLNVDDFTIGELSNHDLEVMTIADLDAGFIRPIIRSVDPSILISHSYLDGNQHHSKVGRAIQIAGRGLRRVYSFIPTENIPRSPGFHPDIFVSLTMEEVEKKAEAFMYYDQDKGPNHIRSFRGIKTDASFYGRMIGVRFAEPLKLERLVL